MLSEMHILTIYAALVTLNLIIIRSISVLLQPFVSLDFYENNESSFGASSSSREGESPSIELMARFLCGVRLDRFG